MFVRDSFVQIFSPPPGTYLPTDFQSTDRWLGEASHYAVCSIKVSDRLQSSGSIDEQLDRVYSVLDAFCLEDLYSDPMDDL